jgi:hypothetical protein
MVQISLPKGVSIEKVSVYRRRAEVTTVEVGFKNPTGQDIIEARVQVPNHPGTREHVITHPKPPRGQSLVFFANAQWDWGGRAIDCTNSAPDWFKDHIEIDFFTGHAEPWNTRVTLKLDQDVSLIARADGTVALADLV